VNNFSQYALQGGTEDNGESIIEEEVLDEAEK